MKLRRVRVDGKVHYVLAKTYARAKAAAQRAAQRDKETR